MRIQPRTIERMRHLPDQPFDGSARQPGIGVESDHVANAGGRDGRTTADCHEGRIRGAAQQAIQLVQLSAFAFPSDPLALPLVPDSPPMEQQETSAFRGRSIALVQTCDSLSGRAEKLVIVWRV